MKGMELSKSYFAEYGREMIENRLAKYKKYIAAGLVGEGSECFGFDDEFSTDHDFGPGFCIWVPDHVYINSAVEIQAAYDDLPKTYKGYTRMQSAQGGGRVGVISTERFYKKFTGIEHAPKDNMEWFRIPESFLATVTNGEIFLDNSGEFSQIRAQLGAFYPEDVIKKKLAAKCAIIAQSGQYNYPRSMKRGDSQAAYFACCEFVKKAMAAIYLLNETYMPYYKWTFRKAEGFRVLRSAVKILKEITIIPDVTENMKRKEMLIEDVSVEIGRELNRRGFTRTTEAFLTAHADELMRNISDTRLKNMHVMADYE